MTTAPGRGSLDRRHQAVDLVRDIAAGTDPSPSFADGLQVQRVLAAVETSSDNDSWQEIPA